MTESEAFDYLYDRAAAHGLTVDELLSITPESVADCPIQSAEFWEDKDISHIYPQSTHPHLANDVTNMMPEDPDLNRPRGAKVMTQKEIDVATADNEADASEIDNDFSDVFDVFDFVFV
jgi:hypothetical protein